MQRRSETHLQVGSGERVFRCGLLAVYVLFFSPISNEIFRDVIRFYRNARKI